jgi:hypothetical protein
MITKKQIQMSETFLNSAVLAVSGGFQDAYTYFTRDKVFSNAQTGNVVLMSQNFLTGNIVGGIKYLFPFLAFGLGVFVTEQINARYKMAKKIHWRQLVLLIEIIILTIVIIIFILHSHYYIYKIFSHTEIIFNILKPVCHNFLFFYKKFANTLAPTTVSIPATAIERLPIAPSISPISIALAVPTACADRSETC